MKKLALLLFLLTAMFNLRAQEIKLVLPTGNSGVLHDFAITKDEKYAATISGQTIVLWNMRQQKKIFEKRLGGGLDMQMKSLSVSDDGNRILVTGRGGTFLVDVRTGNFIIQSSSTYYGSCFSHDQRLVYLNSSTDLELYDAFTGKLFKRIYRVLNYDATEMKLYPLKDPNKLMMVGQWGAYVADLETGKVVMKNEFPKGQKRKYLTWAYWPEQEQLLAATEDSLERFDINANNILSRKAIKNMPVSLTVNSIGQCIFFSKDLVNPKSVAELLDPNSFKVLKTVTLKLRPDEKPLSYEYGRLTRVLKSSGKTFFTIGSTLYRMDPATLHYEEQFGNSIAHIIADYTREDLSFNLPEDGYEFVTDDGFIHGFDGETHRPLNLTHGFPKVVYSNDGKLIANRGDKISIADRRTGKLIKTLQPPADYISYGSIFFSRDGRKIIYVNAYKKLVGAIDIATGAVSRVATFSGSLTAPVNSRDARYLAYTLLLKNVPTLQVMDLETKAILYSKRVSEGKVDNWVTQLVWVDNDRKLVVVEAQSGLVSVLESKTGKLVSEFTVPHNNSVKVIGAAHGMQWLAIGETNQLMTGGYSHVLRLFSLEGKELKTFRPPTGSAFNNAYFSDNNEIVYVHGYLKDLNIYSVKTGELLGTYYFVRGTDEWIFLSPDGLFDGSEAGLKELYFVRDKEIVDLRNLFEKFYTPNLLLRRISGEKFYPPDLAKLHPVPTVEIQYAAATRNLEVGNDIPGYDNTTGMARITVKANAPQDQVDEIRLFHNGKAVGKGTRNLVVVDDNTSTDQWTVDLNLLPGENNIRAIALNSQRTESEPSEISIRYHTTDAVVKQVPASSEAVQRVPTGPLSEVDQSATLYLVVVGINLYQNPKMNLNYALADASSFKTEMEAKSKTVISKVETFYITDTQADKNGIIAAFDQVRRKALPKDVFVFYYAGHGIMSGSGSKEFYLVPNNVAELDQLDATLKMNGISSKELQSYAIQIAAQKQLFVLDACQSAGAFESMLSSSSEQGKSIALLARSTGTHWMAASGSQQFANEFSQLGHGAFTYTLLEAMKGTADNGDAKLTVNELKNYLETKVPELTRKFHGSPQYPSSYGIGLDFPLLRLK